MDFLQQYLSGNGLSQLSTTDKWIVAMVVVAVCVCASDSERPRFGESDRGRFASSAEGGSD